MLPAPHRMRHREDFTRTVRRGRRAGGPLLVVHLLLGDAGRDESCSSAAPARVGLVVSRTVGPAVTRTRVKRRLRHLMAQRVHRLSPGSLLVVRANPPAAAATSAQLGVGLDQALRRAADRAGDRQRAASAVTGAGAGR